MRLRGPWIVRGAGLDTSVSSQSGTILSNNFVYLAMSPYSFFPDVLHRRFFTRVEFGAQLNLFLPPNADAPYLQLYNPIGATAPYAAAWRHVNP